jgi:deoxyribodipyrimidine photo-lyase
MNNSPLNIVWLKRDLRTRDHAALAAAEARHMRYLIIYLVEPDWLQRSDFGLRHWQFVGGSIADINQRLKPFGLDVKVFFGDPIEVFSWLCDHYPVDSVYSYQESGTLQTWERDRGVAAQLKRSGTNWQQFQTGGVVRGSRNRRGWDRQWFASVDTAPIENHYRRHPTIQVQHPFSLPADLSDALLDYPAQMQPPGESKAWAYLSSFAAERGHCYMQNISKPGASRTSGGRVSPYLAWGNLSSRQVYRFIIQHPNYARHKKNFSAFTTRLKWRCHFIQKFEVECRYEDECINRGFELLQYQPNDDFIRRWQSGDTGYPLVDACMRCVIHSGWLNFRMRAMLVSFLCHHLDQDWRIAAAFLARQFLDYEPGIHFPQVQMQAGTTGINTIRIYNPVKQSQDQDAGGQFIKKWLPELTNLPSAYLHQPWLMPPFEQVFNNFALGVDYPEPLVDIAASGARARDKLWGHRQHPEVQMEKSRLLRTHTRNR